MRSSVYLAILPSLLSAATALAATPLSSVKKGGSNLPQAVVPNKFIIEVDNLSSIPNKRSFARTLDSVYASLQERAVGYDINHEFDSNLFVGASVTLKTAQDAAALANTPGVKAIRPVVRFKAPKPVKSHVVTGPNDSGVPADSESTHILTGVDKLHAEGNFGAGITIGIIDTGIDYTHPALGGKIGPGNKVIGGYDFVGDLYDGSNNPIPDSDPLDQCNGHGTHVAGIIGADPSNPFNISGVAYQASIAAYRVFGCDGNADDDVIVAALLKAADDGVHILTLSLGGADGWTEGTSTVVASRIAASGKIVTIAAGNDGASGSWYSSGPGNGIDVISVASLDNTVIPLQNLTVSGIQHDPITYFSTFPLPVNGTLPIYPISNDTTVANDACNPLPASTPDLSPYVVVIRRGSCTFVQKITNVAAKGATVALIYDNGSGFAGISVGDFKAVLIQAADGESLVKSYASGAKVSVTFPQEGSSTEYPDPTGGLISEFTSYGPSNDFYFKPAIAAPGGNILSTVPVALGSYAVLSGTSMATPFVAGSAALVLAAKGKSKDVVLNVRTLFETTSKSVPSSKTDGDPLQTLTQQGAGLIDVYTAIHTTTIASPGELILNDTAHFKPEQTFTVKNTDNKSKAFKLTHVPAGTALTVQNGSIFPADGPVPLSTVSASVTISPSTFTLGAGESQKVVATFSFPSSGIDKSTYPVFSGYIQVSGPSVADSVHVSYLGLGGSLKSKQVLDDTDLIFDEKIPAILDSVGEFQTVPTNYTFVDEDYPSLLWRLVFGTPSLRIDLVDANLKFTPTIKSRALGPLSPLFSFPHQVKGGSFAQVKIIGPLGAYDYITRNDEDTFSGGNGYNVIDFKKPTFANGTTIPNGQYRVLLRALRVTGDPTNEADYDSWLSPIVGVKV